MRCSPDSAAHDGGQPLGLPSLKNTTWGCRWRRRWLQSNACQHKASERESGEAIRAQWFDYVAKTRVILRHVCAGRGAVCGGQAGPDHQRSTKSFTMHRSPVDTADNVRNALNTPPFTKGEGGFSASMHACAAIGIGPCEGQKMLVANTT
jgi:hypothetical protein